MSHSPTSYFWLAFDSASRSITAPLTVAAEVGLRTYTLEILLRGLEVPTFLDQNLSVYPTVTSAVTSEFTGNLQEYRTGQATTLRSKPRQETSLTILEGLLMTISNFMFKGKHR